MDDKLQHQLATIANTIRQLSMEAVQKANSGHPGLPMGCAEIGAYLYGVALRHNPKNPRWENRDRFILSAGHGSMLLYSCLHLSGFELSLDEIKNFRQLHSATAGHPEYNLAPGIEATTGPLGQGVANAVGQALAYKILQTKFNREDFHIFSNKIYCLAGDGCMMEGVASEASSLAGHLGLDNLIIIYDANKVSLDGPLQESMSEDTKLRYQSYGFDVVEVDGHNFEELDEAFTHLSHHQQKPTLIMAHTIIGKGAPNKAGSYKVHGSPLGEEEVKAAKKELHLPDEAFFIPASVKEFFAKRLKDDQMLESKWNEVFFKWKKTFPDLANEYEVMKEKIIPADLEMQLAKIEIKDPISGREASQKILEVLAEKLPFIYGGSADLSSSDKTFLKKYPVISNHHYEGRNIKYGVREFAMGAIANGLYTSDFIIPVCGTFLTFSDYMRNAIRLAALSPYHVIYQFTHDSIFLGEDGPTHQSVEHLAALRAIPHLCLIRPGSAWETKMAWIAALKHKGPTALILTRQGLAEVQSTHVSYDKGVAKGAYVIMKEQSKPDYILAATGSELPLSVEVADQLKKKGKDIRVVSFPSWELFDMQDASYKKSIFLEDVPTISIEAGISQGWHKYIGKDGLTISVDQFGYSAPAKALQKEFGFVSEAIVGKIFSAK